MGVLVLAMTFGPVMAWRKAHCRHSIVASGAIMATMAVLAGLALFGISLADLPVSA